MCAWFYQNLDHFPSLHILSNQIPVIRQVDQAFQAVAGGDFLGVTDTRVVQDQGVEFIAFFEAACFSEKGTAADSGHIEGFLQRNRSL